MRKDKSEIKKEISIIGTGKAGTSLAYSLKKKGWKILYLFDKDDSAVAESQLIIGGGRIENNIEKIIENGDFFVLSVPDGELRKITKKIVGLNKSLKGKVFIQLSGSVPSKILEPIKEKGGHTGSLHPIFPFFKKKVKIPEGTFFGWEGDEEAFKKCVKIVEDLKGKLVEIKKDKILYHLGCSIASNLLSILYLMALEKSKEAGIEEKIAKKFLTSLSFNSILSVEEMGWEGVTGPAVRGDKETIKNHLKKLSPIEKRIYKNILLYFIEKGYVKEAEGIIEILKEKE